MKIDRISYQKTYPTGQYANEKIGVEATIEEGEDVQFALCNLKHECDEIHRKNNPHLYQETTVFHTPEGFTNGLNVISQPIEPQPKPSIQTYIEQIQNCKSINQLKEWEILAKTNEKLSEAYQQKLTQLTNNQ